MRPLSFIRYIRAEGDEADVIRLCTAAGRRGILLSPLEAMTIWQWYSETRYSAGWIALNGDGMNRALDAWMATYDMEAPDAHP